MIFSAEAAMENLRVSWDIFMGFNGWQPEKPRMLKQHLPWQRDGDESHMVM